MHYKWLQDALSLTFIAQLIRQEGLDGRNDLGRFNRGREDNTKVDLKRNTT